MPALNESRITEPRGATREGVASEAPSSLRGSSNLVANSRQRGRGHSRCLPETDATSVASLQQIFQ
ncbi:hypothetical protein N9R65_03885 [Opitutales bacterium]|nr:hypothetical protein [Opitutales bacterium]